MERRRRLVLRGALEPSHSAELSTIVFLLQHAMPDEQPVVLHRQGCFPALVAKQDRRPAKDASLVR